MIESAVEYIERIEMSQTELELRRMVAISRSDWEHLYQDDGEIQDSFERPYIDYLRDSVNTIQNKLRERNIIKLDKEIALKELAKANQELGLKY